MQPNLRFLIFLVSLLFLPFIFSDARKNGLPGAWTPIENISDPHVVEIAEFAVSEYNNQSQASLKLVKVVKGETQVVAGVNYRLYLKAKDADRAKTKTYEAVVWEKTWEDFKNLTSFKLVKG